QQYTDSRARRALDSAPGVVAYYAEDIMDVENAEGHTFQLRAIEGMLDQFPFTISEGRFLEPDSGEALAGQGLLDWLELEIGDSISLTLKDDSGPPTTWRIVGTHPEPVNAGQMLMVSLSSVKRAHWETEPRTYYLKLATGADTGLLKDYLEPRKGADLNLTLIGHTLPDAVVYLQFAILALSAILIGIALINVFNTSVLAVREKMRLIGILKTVGMTPRQVMAMVCTSTGVLGFLATLVGVPLGLVFTQTVLSALSRGYGFGQVQISIRPTTILLLFPLMICVSVAGSLVPGRRAARASILEVLRYE
ncbi:MAG: FtsX-like permease family protein, partial [Anaerolineae bacterium]|nr:FtsX-like permease family protein [Anaerolineae bacterium]